MSISDLYRNKVVVVAGGGGSIGSQICERLLTLGVKKVVAADFSEYNLFSLLEKTGNHECLDPVLLDWTNDEMIRAFEDEWPKVDYVFNAAAYKHVNLVQVNKAVGTWNNLKSAINARDCAFKKGAKFIQISSDKAVRPINYMGYSKRLCEHIALELNSKISGEGRVVRFGNVLNSSGSVLPIFENQISNGGPVTVTHRCATRYFMSLGAAVDLVLTCPLATFKYHPIFALDMGQQINIFELAQSLIRQNGFLPVETVPNTGEIQIKIIGLREGEKLSEELSYGNTRRTNYPTLLEAIESKSDFETVNVLTDILRHQKFDAINQIFDIYPTDYK